MAEIERVCERIRNRAASAPRQSPARLFTYQGQLPAGGPRDQEPVPVEPQEGTRGDAGVFSGRAQRTTG